MKVSEFKKQAADLLLPEVEPGQAALNIASLFTNSIDVALGEDEDREVAADEIVALRNEMQQSLARVQEFIESDEGMRAMITAQVRQGGGIFWWLSSLAKLLQPIL